MNFLETIRAIPGTDFLSMFISLEICCIFTALLLRGLIYPPRSRFSVRPESLSPEKSAALRGSRTHTIMTALFELQLQKAVSITHSSEPIVVTEVPETLSSLKRTILSYLRKQPVTPDQLLLDSEIEKLTNPWFKKTYAQFEEQNLLKSAPLKQQELFILLLTLSPILIFGLTKLALGISSGKPVLFLAAAAAVGTVILCAIMRIGQKYTPQGIAFLRSQERQFRWLKTVPRTDLSSEESAKLAYIPAVLGVGALAGMIEFHEFFRSMKDTDAPMLFSHSARGNESSSSSSSGCSGGGCGSSSGCSGGGCGGCGGGGD